MKKLLILFMLFTLIYCGGCSQLIKNIDAEIKITDSKQSKYEILNEYSSVEIHYNISNIGNRNIDYYKIFIEITCEDGSIYNGFDNGLNINIGKKISDFTYINTAGKKYKEVKIIDYKLTSY